jgi:hypothetical protein
MATGLPEDGVTKASPQRAATDPGYSYEHETFNHEHETQKAATTIAGGSVPHGGWRCL